MLFREPLVTSGWVRASLTNRSSLKQVAHFCSKCELLGLGESLVVKLFPSKQEDLSSRCRTHMKKSGMAAQACNTNPGEVETGGSVGLTDESA